MTRRTRVKKVGRFNRKGEEISKDAHSDLMFS